MRSVVAGMLLFLVAAGVAHADNKQVAKEAFVEGSRQYELGDFKAALDAFKRAYLNYEEPAFLFNIAQCQRQLGDKPEAIRTYKIFLRKVPHAPQRAEVERIIADLQAAAEQEKAARTRPPMETMQPPAATATTPASPPPPVATPAAPVSEPAVAAAPASPAPAADHQPLYKKWWLWTAVGVVAVGVGLGVGLGVGVGVGVGPKSTPRNAAMSCTSDGVMIPRRNDIAGWVFSAFWMRAGSLTAVEGPLKGG